MKTTNKQPKQLLYSMNDAAAILGISRKSLEREIQAGRFPAPVRIGTICRICDEDLSRYIQGLREQRLKQLKVPEWFMPENTPIPASVGPRACSPNDPARLP